MIYFGREKLVLYKVQKHKNKNDQCQKKAELLHSEERNDKHVQFYIDFLAYIFCETCISNTHYITRNNHFSIMFSFDVVFFICVKILFIFLSFIRRQNCLFVLFVYCKELKLVFNSH